MLNDGIEKKHSIFKKRTKNNISQPYLTFQTHDLDNENLITPWKAIWKNTQCLILRQSNVDEWN
jgi:hypothetical protein